MKHSTAPHSPVLRAKHSDSPTRSAAGQAPRDAATGKRLPASNSRNGGKRYDWRRELDRLKHSLADASLQPRTHYHHAVLLVEGELPDGFTSVPPNVHVRGVGVQRVIPVRLPRGGFHVHFIFDDSPAGGPTDDLDLLVDILWNIKHILHAVPRHLLPIFDVPNVTDGRTECLLIWLYLLNWLGHDRDNTVFNSWQQCLRFKGEYVCRPDFEDWKTCSTLPGFDLVPFLTLTDTGESGLDSWREEHRSKGKPLPEIIASSLSKPLWYASMNAIDRILACRNAGRPEPRVPTPRRKRSPNTPDWVLYLLTVLCKHHVPEDADPCFEPLSAKEIGRHLGWKQPDVSKRLKKLLSEVPFAKGLKQMNAYKALCRNRRIGQELNRLSLKHTNPELARLLLTGDPERFAAPRAED